ncbi:PAP2 superfamily protein [Methyloligella halotolerans]|uniref:PAP2 superfamily protein n=1 Tax=Methyloligella halotolerans TaxID=1177755 RepID=A0A1E2RYR0_9HYPH|nr:phosphatase PAP2 family protein [Methyloligella halotolerans]ODA67363.1 PAP2 superfamily protein [Methyloligella halotolerans]
MRIESPSFFTLTCLAGLAAAVVFVGFPDLDLAVADLFYFGKRHFLADPSLLGNVMRQSFRLLFLFAVLVALFGLGLSVATGRKLFGFGFPHWLAVVLTLFIGPGLIANVIFKDNWGRARPFYVEQFGGPQKFTPALKHSDQCARNCSFVSGEASSIYAVFFAFAFLIRRRRREIFIAGLAIGTLAGLLRIASGSHFLSDVIFAGVFMGLAVRGAFALVFEMSPVTFAEGGKLHCLLHQGVTAASAQVAEARRQLLGGGQRIAGRLAASLML